MNVVVVVDDLNLNRHFFRNHVVDDVVVHRRSTTNVNKIVDVLICPMVDVENDDRDRNPIQLDPMDVVVVEIDSTMNNVGIFFHSNSIFDCVH